MGLERPKCVKCGRPKGWNTRRLWCKVCAPRKCVVCMEQLPPSFVGSYCGPCKRLAQQIAEAHRLGLSSPEPWTPPVVHDPFYRGGIA